MATKKETYPASLNISYPKKLDRVSSFFRILLSIPILIILAILTSSGGGMYVNEAGKVMLQNGSGITGALFAATALMLLFRQRYPKWWFDFNLELERFTMRVLAYLLLLTDKYPSTEDTQLVKLNLEYPNAKKDLNRWMPLVKWLLAIPHYTVLVVLVFATLLATIIAWFSILFTGKYPKSLFDFVVGVSRWVLRVEAYAFYLTTDKYPPFSLK